MKRQSMWQIPCLWACQLLWPFLKLLSSITKLEFYFTSEPLYLILTGAVTIILTRSVLTGSHTPSPWSLLILFPVTIIAGTLEVLFFRTVFALPITITNCFCTGVLFQTYVPVRWYKYLMTLACTLLLIPYGFLCWLDLIFCRIGVQTIVQEVTSPDGSKTAQLIDDDQGALGGNTFLYIRYPTTVPLGFGGLRPDSTELYRGRWGEFENIILSWQDDHTLLINNQPVYLE